EAAGELAEERVEALVELQVAADVGARVREEPVDLVQARASTSLAPWTRPALGCQACGGALEHAAQLDRIPDVALRELADCVATPVERLEQALLGQPCQ